MVHVDSPVARLRAYGPVDRMIDLWLELDSCRRRVRSAFDDADRVSALDDCRTIHTMLVRGGYAHCRAGLCWPRRLTRTVTSICRCDEQP